MSVFSFFTTSYGDMKSKIFYLLDPLCTLHTIILIIEVFSLGGKGFFVFLRQNIRNYADKPKKSVKTKKYKQNEKIEKN